MLSWRVGMGMRQHAIHGHAKCSRARYRGDNDGTTAPAWLFMLQLSQDHGAVGTVIPSGHLLTIHRYCCWFEQG